MPDLDFAILCDYVRAGNGIAHLIAGGIDTVYAPQVPAGQNVGLLIRLTFGRHECGKPHRIEVIFQDEDGERLAYIDSTLVPEWDETLPKGWDVGALLALNFGIPLPRHGLYSFEVHVDDRREKSLRLRVVEPD